MHEPHRTYDAAWLEREAQRSLQRLQPKIEAALQADPDASAFLGRLQAHFPRVFRHLLLLYGNQYDFFYHLEQVLLHAAQMYRARSAALRDLDDQRLNKPDWYQSHEMLGAVCYVDLFAGTLNGLRDKIDYFKELGVTYLHLMPLFDAPAANSDGGYAVSDYRTVNPALGTMDDLAALAADLRAAGISLVLDFIFNHTSDEHSWAQAAIAGTTDADGNPHRDYYYTFPDRNLPDQYERTLREIFPEQAPGNFTWNEAMQRWVWTTFYRFQWDLNYRNPAVFNAMLGELLFLANVGVEVVRLDAVAFVWKRLGTPCESLPEAHHIIRAYNALMQIVAPAVVFKSEAIVHPDQVAEYVNPQEAPLSYNPTLMALLWESMATRKVSLLLKSMQRSFSLLAGCTWVNYIRVHDDIGWTYADEDAAELGIDAYDHRQFLNQFYSGHFPGSFARGLPFGHNVKTGDMRISGMAASLIGLEEALEQDDPNLLDDAIKRLLLMYSVIMSAGGIPLIYLGDEIAMLNDYSFQDDPNRREDSRWAHRVRFDWLRAEQRHDADSVPGRVYGGVQQLIRLRKQLPTLAGKEALFFDAGNVHVLGFARGGGLIVLANFSEVQRIVPQSVLRNLVGSGQQVVDLISNKHVAVDVDLTLEAYQYCWLEIAR